MKPLDVSRTQTLITPSSPTRVSDPRPTKIQVPAPADLRSAAPLAQGLTHVAPSEGHAAQPGASALDILQSQQPKAEPHRRGRTAALRVGEVKVDPGTKRAFRPVVELIVPLQEALERFGIGR
jgi:hypothetical protein